VILFNKGLLKAEISVNFSDIGIKPLSATIRDLINKKDLGQFTKSFSSSV